MIDFQPIDQAKKEYYEQYLQSAGERGCVYGFVNLYLWGRQKAAVVHDNLVFFCQFNRKSVYLFPVGPGDKKSVLEEVIQDAKARGIPCRFTGLTGEDCALLEALYPGKFRYHCDRDAFDYIYSIDDLADLAGRKFQKKRNHLNKFRINYPDHILEPVSNDNIDEMKQMVETWYRLRLEENPHADYHMEHAAIKKAMEQWAQLGMEGLLLRQKEQILAMTMGSRLNSDTFDIHFEKALDVSDGTYAAINNGFARYLREKYPDIKWLNREEDMGIEGLRRAKLSYNPHRMVEKSWACLLEDGYDY